MNIVDDQKLSQFINDQNLMNLSLIEQLNEQAQYLNSIVERLEVIYQTLMEMSNLPRPTPNVNPLNLDISRAKAVMIGSNEEKTSQTTQSENVERETLNETSQTEMVAEQATFNLEPPEIYKYLVIGDRIQVITKNLNQAGVFIEIAGEYLVWVIDGGQLAFTDLKGSSIMKLT